MKRVFLFAGLTLAGATAWLLAQSPAGDPLIEGFRGVEVASVADAMEQLYGQKTYMSHEMRPLAPTKFAGPAVTVLLKKGEHKDGAAASQGMLDAIDNAAPGSVYVMVLDDGVDYAGIGGLMATAMKYRGFAGAVVDASVRDTPQIRQACNSRCSAAAWFPRPPSTTTASPASNVPVTCAGALVNAGDIIVGDEDGVAVVPQSQSRGRAEEGAGARQYGAQHVPVHREIQIDQRGRREVRPDLTSRRAVTHHDAPI